MLGKTEKHVEKFMESRPFPDIGHYIASIPYIVKKEILFNIKDLLL